MSLQIKLSLHLNCRNQRAFCNAQQNAYYVLKKSLTRAWI